MISIGNYLPLTGGTLTGALTTSSGDITAGGDLVTTNGYVRGAGSSGTRFNIGTGTTGQAILANFAITAGVGFDVTTDGTLKLRNKAFNGDGTLTAGAGTFSALLTTVASATGSAGLNVPHGAAPTSPVNGDVWTTTAGLFVRINGTTKTVTLT
jgi:hypothetical protein